MLAAQGMMTPSTSTTISETSQCHDITVYPALGLAGGACEGHGLLLDISNPVNPVRLDAVADSGGQQLVKLRRPTEVASETVILGAGPDAAVAVVDMLEELGVL